MGIERIRAVIVDNCEGLGAALDAAMQASADATYDPWKNRSQDSEPVHSIIEAEA
jgi:nitrite reductase (NADH) large subunit